MTKQIKFRQILPDGTFHYWGFLNRDGVGVFTSPYLNDSPEVALKNSDQFTEIVDKKGREIYENDIVVVRHDYGSGEQNVNLQVTSWEKEGFLIFGGAGVPGSDASLIGNIYEDPELLLD